MVGERPPGARLTGDPDDAADAAPPWPAAEAAIAISDVTHVRAILIAWARQRQPITYADLLNALGHPFSRPRMRALCRTLDAVDEVGRAASEPELAVLVVRQSDGLPGQGWWVGRSEGDAPRERAWTGPDAKSFVQELQEKAFAFWAGPANGS